MKVLLIKFALLAMLHAWLGQAAVANNSWPLMVHRTADDFQSADRLRFAGPLVELKDGPSELMVSIRPFWTRYRERSSGSTRTHILYPFLNLTSGESENRGHLLNLLRWNAQSGRALSFEVFPFLFRRESAGGSTLALWPVGGTIHNRFWRDRIDFVLWPLYVRTLKDGERHDHFIYPFVRTLRGPESHGWGIWPFWGDFERENTYRHRWALWPIYYDFADKLDEAEAYRRFGILPFYARESAEGMKSETWGWPFFGYTEEFAPRPLYREVRYFWPFIVRGSGVERRVERWLPFYAEEARPGYQKRWLGWPLWKEERIEESGRVRERETLLYFLYRNERQQLAGGSARLTTLWPLWAYWEDGAGRRQLQILDPLTVFFPANRVVKDTWAPLFSLYTFEERAGAWRSSFLWDLLVLEAGPTSRKFVLGPLFEWEEGRHWSLLKGLLGSDKRAAKWEWRFLWNKRPDVAD